MLPFRQRCGGYLPITVGRSSGRSKGISTGEQLNRGARLGVAVKARCADFGQLVAVGAQGGGLWCYCINQRYNSSRDITHITRSITSGYTKTVRALSEIYVNMPEANTINGCGGGLELPVH